MLGRMDLEAVTAVDYWDSLTYFFGADGERGELQSWLEQKV